MISDQEIRECIYITTVQRVFVYQFSIDIKLCFFRRMAACKCHMHPFASGYRTLAQHIAGCHISSKFHIRIQIENAPSRPCLLEQIFFVRAAAKHIVIAFDPCHQRDIILSCIDCIWQFQRRCRCSIKICRTSRNTFALFSGNSAALHFHFLGRL